MHHILRFALGFFFCASVASAAWYKGNTHTHTLNSDGDSSPDDVVKWYRENHYSFLFITDHETITNVAPLNALLATDRFLVMAGEEVTCNYPGTPPLAVHINALNPQKLVLRQKGRDARDTLQINVAAVKEAGALAHINHPNFRWMLQGADVASLPNGPHLLEIANMHPIVNRLGAGKDFPSDEGIWDQALTLGAVLWGTATDDMHHLKTGESRAIGTAGENSRPGRGWIVVRAEALTPENIMTALAKGDFYASTGVALKDLQASPKEIKLSIRPSKSDVSFDTKYLVQFIGREGRVVHEVVALEAVYVPKGEEGYVRVRITDSNGQQAWTQPVFLDDRLPKSR